MSHPVLGLDEIRVRLTFIEEVLGTSNSDLDIHGQFIASKAPDAPSREEEVKALGVEKVIEKGKTVFARDPEEDPVLWDYQIKGFFKDACGMLRRTPYGVWSSKLTAHKKIIDGLIFPKPRMIKLQVPEGKALGNCQRPLRVVDANGERVAIAHSEAAPIGTVAEFGILFMELASKKPKKAKKGESEEDEAARLQRASPNLRSSIIEWLNYGEFRGLAQWRNSGKGRFIWKECK